jgi:hypothetical protein
MLSVFDLGGTMAFYCNHPVTALRITKHALREFDLRGPDGHRLRFGQPISDQPPREE